MTDEVWKVGDPAPGTKASVLGALDPLIGTPRRQPADLADFLLARISEDEVIAQAAHKYLVQHAKDFYDDVEDPGDWRRSWAGFGRSAWSDAPGYISTQIQRHDPARILAECAAKRAIVGSSQSFKVAYEQAHPLAAKLTSAGAVAAFEVTLKFLALPYADHPDWREEWRP